MRIPRRLGDSMYHDEARQHALDCGLDMTGACARYITGDCYDACGYAAAHAVIDPVHLDVLVRPGTVFTRRMLEWLRAFGVDYVTVMV